MTREEKIRYIKLLSRGEIIHPAEISLGKWVHNPQKGSYVIVHKYFTTRFWEEYINTDTKETLQFPYLIGYPNSESTINDYFFLTDSQLAYFKNPADHVRQGHSFDAFKIMKKPATYELAEWALRRFESTEEKLLILTIDEYDAELKRIFNGVKQGKLEPLQVEPFSKYFLNN